MRPGEDDPRFGMLETIREYAGERLAGRGERSSLRERHAAHFLDLAESLGADFHGPRQQWVLSRLREERANLREALQWSLEPDGILPVGLRLAVALLPFWLVTGAISEGRDWLAALLNRSDNEAPELRARALHARGSLAREQGDGADAGRRLDARGTVGFALSG